MRAHTGTRPGHAIRTHTRAPLRNPTLRELWSRPAGRPPGVSGEPQQLALELKPSCHSPALRTRAPGPGLDPGHLGGCRWAGRPGPRGSVWVVIRDGDPAEGLTGQPTGPFFSSSREGPASSPALPLHALITSLARAPLCALPHPTSPTHTHTHARARTAWKAGGEGPRLVQACSFHPDPPPCLAHSQNGNQPKSAPPAASPQAPPQTEPPAQLLPPPWAGPGP